MGLPMEDIEQRYPMSRRIGASKDKLRGNTLGVVVSIRHRLELSTLGDTGHIDLPSGRIPGVYWKQSYTMDFLIFSGAYSLS